MGFFCRKLHQTCTSLNTPLVLVTFTLLYLQENSISGAKFLRHRRKGTESLFYLRNDSFEAYCSSYSSITENSQAVIRCYLDCCKVTTDGNSEFKGSYTFPTILAGNVSEKNCKYSGKATAIKAYARCQTNMEVGPYYDSLNVNSCKAKYKTTQVLDKLNEVRTFAIYSVRKYFAFLYWATVETIVMIQQ